MNAAVESGQLAETISAAYGVRVLATERIPLGTATDNFRLHTESGPLFAKVYRDGTDLDYERAILDVTDSAHGAGIAVPGLRRDRHGQLLHACPAGAVSIWQWQDTDPLVGPVTPDQAHTVGQILARLHKHLQPYGNRPWPTAQPHYYRHTLNQIRQRFMAVARHIEGLATRTDTDETNLEHIRQRLTDLARMPELIAAAPPPAKAVLHGDFVRPNWLIHHGKVEAVIDLRIKFDDPVREIGRMAFDVPTIGATAPQQWLAVAQAALTGYLAEGGIVAPSQFYGAARHALLHSLCTTFPIEDLHLDSPPAHIRDDLHSYWANRVTTVRAMLDNLGAIDDMVAAITGKPAPNMHSVSHAPSAPVQDGHHLAVLAAARTHLLTNICDNAESLGVQAVLLWGSAADGRSDPLSDLDIIAVTREPLSPAEYQLLARQLLHPLPLLFSRTVTANGPRDGFYQGLCADVHGWPLWTDVYLWPANTATKPTDTITVFDHAALPPSSRTFWDLLSHHRASPDGNPLDEPGSEQHLRILVAAKRFARGDQTGAQQQLRAGNLDAAGLRQALSDASAACGIDAMKRWTDLAIALAGGPAWRSPSWWDCVLLRHTTKSTVVRVNSPDGPVAVKLLTTADPYWRQLAQREQTFYQVAERLPDLKMMMPRLLHAGEGITVVSWLAGQALHGDRYPAEPLDPQHVNAALEALRRFGASAWDAMPTGTEHARHVHSLARQQLEPADAAGFEVILGMLREWSPQHGDAIPSNLIISSSGTCDLTDFEHVSWHPNGFDYATLRICLSGQTSTITSMIDTFGERQAGKLAYLANRIAIAAREKNIHHQLPADEHTARRAQLLAAEWDRAVAQLRAHPAVQHLYKETRS